jgi:hypothetical protein
MAYETTEDINNAEFDRDAVAKRATLTTQLDPNNHGLQAFPPESTTEARITTNTTTVVKSVPCWFRIKVQNGTMGAVTVYNNTAGSGTVLYTGTPAAKDILFGEWTYASVGLTIVTAAATELFIETLTI